MKLREVNIIIITIGVLAIAIFLTLFTDELGFDSSLGSDFILMLPGIIVSIIGIFVMTATKGLFVIPASGTVGIGLAYLLGGLNTQGYLTNDLLQSSTITQVQMLIIVSSVIIGGVKASRGS